jgi:hypothetical protein
VKPLQLGLSLIPVAIIVIGLIGWVVTLRGNIDAAIGSIEELQQSQYDDSDLMERVQELSVANEEGMTKLAWIMEEYGPAIESIRDGDRLFEVCPGVGDGPAGRRYLEPGVYPEIRAQLPGGIRRRRRPVHIRTRPGMLPRPGEQT